MILSIGEILFDVYPDQRYLGGAPFNFIYHLKHFGVPVVFVTRVGNDAAGKSILKTLEENDFNTEYVQVDNRKRTGKVLVELDKDKTPGFNILSDAAYDHIQYNSSLKSLLKHDIRLIYFGTLVQRTPNGFATIQKILSQKNPRSKCFYDINLRPNCYRKEVLVESLKYTDLLKLNQDEYHFLGNVLNQGQESPDLFQHLFNVYHIEIIAVTQGQRGSVIVTNAERHDIQTTSKEPVADTVGAGDAYASVLALGYLKKWPVTRTLSLANQFAARICTIEGALPKSNEIYQEMIQIMEA